MLRGTATVGSALLTLINGQGLTISGLAFEHAENGLALVYTEAGGVFNGVTVQDCDFHDIQWANFTSNITIIYEGGNAIRLVNSNAERCNGTATPCQTPLLENLLLANCIFERVDMAFTSRVARCGLPAGVRSGVRTTGAQVHGNLFSNCSFNTVMVDAAERFSIQHNVFLRGQPRILFGYGTTDVIIAYADATTVVANNDFTLRGEHVGDPDGCPIDLETDTHNLTLGPNNTFWRPVGASVNVFGHTFSGHPPATSQNLTIRGNAMIQAGCLQGKPPYHTGSSDVGTVAFDLPGGTGAVRDNLIVRCVDTSVPLWGGPPAYNKGFSLAGNEILPAGAETSRIVALPTVTAASGAGQTWPFLTVTCTTPGVAIRYTLDGSRPTDTSPVWPPTAAEATGARVAVLVRAFKAGLHPSASNGMVVGGDAKAPTRSPQPPNDFMARCKAGCATRATICNASSPLQRWTYSSTTDASLSLEAAIVNATVSLCLNVRDYGLSAGDECWITLCHPEHPLKANEGWQFDAGAHTLRNTRSGLCASAPNNRAVAPATSQPIVLATCSSAAARGWMLDGVTAQVRVGNASCLEAIIPATPPRPPAPPAPFIANVSVDLGRVVSEADSRLVSFTLDGSFNRGWFQRDLSNPLLRFLTQQLAAAGGGVGAVLRMGGSGNDYFDYDVPAGAVQPTAPACRPGSSYPKLPATGHCPPWLEDKHCADHIASIPGFCAHAKLGPQPNCCRECGYNWNGSSFPWPHGGEGGCSRWSHGGTPATLTCTCLTQARFDALLEFAAATNVSLVFGLSFAYDANSTHTVALLSHVARWEMAHNVTGAVYAYEYGNEQANLSRSAEQLGILQDSVLPPIYAAQGPGRVPPRLIGPDWFSAADGAFLQAANARNLSLHAYTFHEYLGAATIAAGGEVLTRALASATLLSLRKAGAKPSVALWVGEAGGVAGGGAPGVTEGYASGRWWLASLGAHARHGVSVFCRQTLVGGDYGLLRDNFPWNLPVNNTTAAMRAVEPTADWWTALLWKSLMGPRVLNATVVGSESLLVYTHCSQRTAGGLSVVVINTADSNATASVAFMDEQLRKQGRNEWVLSPAGTMGIALNGRALALQGAWGSWALPPLQGRSMAAGTPILVPAGRYMLLEYPAAAIAACQGA